MLFAAIATQGGGTAAYALSPEDFETADSPYYIYVEKGSHSLTVFIKDGQGRYTVPLKTFPTGTGRTGRMTPAGVFRKGRSEQWHSWGSSYSPFASEYYPGLYVHGPIYAQKNFATLYRNMAAQIGTSATSGCLRTVAEAAYFVAEHCPEGTIIHIVEGSPIGYYADPPDIAGQAANPSGKTPDELFPNLADLIRQASEEANGQADADGQAGAVRSEPHTREEKLEFAPYERIMLNRSKLVLRAPAEQAAGFAAERAKLSARVSPPGAKDRAVLWMSSDIRVATVGQTGTVEARSPGSAQIFAISADGLVAAACDVSVIPGADGQAAGQDSAATAQAQGAGANSAASAGEKAAGAAAADVRTNSAAAGATQDPAAAASGAAQSYAATLAGAAQGAATSATGTAQGPAASAADASNPDTANSARDTGAPGAAAGAHGVAATAGATGGATAQAKPDGPFEDVGRRHWAAGPIEALVRAGAIDGSGAVFFPERDITKAEFVKMLASALGWRRRPAAPGRGSEAAAQAWHEPYVRAAMRNGLFGDAEELKISRAPSDSGDAPNAQYGGSGNARNDSAGETTTTEESAPPAAGGEAGTMPDGGDGAGANGKESAPAITGSAGTDGKAGAMPDSNDSAGTVADADGEAIAPPAASGEAGAMPDGNDSAGADAEEDAAQAESAGGNHSAATDPAVFEFDPDAWLTRGELCEWLNNLNGSNTPLRFLIGAGAAAGASAGAEGPGAQSAGGLAAQSAGRPALTFTDARSIKDADAAARIAAAGLLNGFSDGSFRSGAYVSRATAAAIINNIRKGAIIP
jgi:hypothetical protein